MLFTGRTMIAGKPARTARRETPIGESQDLFLQDLAAEHREDNARMTWLVVLAAVVHAVLLLVTFPELTGTLREVTQKGKPVYVVQQVRFKPPPPRPQQARPRKDVKKIPIPDPTPLEPEPIVVEEIPVPEVDLPGPDVVFGIPNAPPGEGSFDGWGDILEVGGGVTAPVKIYAPEPRYTEEARQARIQGMVILRAVIDTKGDVVQVKVIKDLPLGLTESAVETVGTWKYKPALQDGEPVPVYYLISVNFRLM